MKNIFTKEFKIGIFVILAIVILIFGIDYLKGINLFSPANFYYANYSNVQGLEIAAPVTINGYKVGQVREINFNYEHPGEVKVLLALNKDLKLPEDSRAVIASTMLSGAYINIEMGSSPKMLDKGSDIKTATGTDLMANVSGNLLPAVNNILPKVDSIMANLTRISGDPALLTSIQRLDGITNNVYGITAGLQSTVSKDVPAMMNRVSRISNGLDTVVANLGVLSSQLKSLPLNATMDNVNDLTANLNSFSRQLNDKNSTLGKLMNDPELYNRISTVAADVDSLIVDIKRNPKRYISIKVF